ncbi:MAG: type II toxin-antitoxin system HicB family antitoxin [Gemmatimonadaceae bacterium]|nr:type II toxin-antitoxin system HicB family antitoxin [Gemmatimonadaceae bacterium]
MKFVAIIERTGTGYSAWLPTLPGCVAAAPTRDEVEALIREAVEFHLEGMIAAGEEVDPLSDDAEVVTITVAG